MNLSIKYQDRSPIMGGVIITCFFLSILFLWGMTVVSAIEDDQSDEMNQWVLLADENTVVDYTLRDQSSLSAPSLIEFSSDTVVRFDWVLAEGYEVESLNVHVYDHDGKLVETQQPLDSIDYEQSFFSGSFKGDIVIELRTRLEENTYIITGEVNLEGGAIIHGIGEYHTFDFYETWLELHEDYYLDRIIVTDIVTNQSIYYYRLDTFRNSHNDMKVVSSGGLYIDVFIKHRDRTLEYDVSNSQTYSERNSESSYVYGSHVTLTISAEEGYYIEDVLLNDVSIGGEIDPFEQVVEFTIVDDTIVKVLTSPLSENGESNIDGDEDLTDELVPEGALDILGDSIHMNMTIYNMVDFINLDQNLAPKIVLKSVDRMATEGALEGQYLKFIGESSYTFNIMAGEGDSSFSIGSLINPVEMRIDIDLGLYTDAELSRLGAYRLDGDDWLYVGGYYDRANKQFVYNTRETGAFSIMMGYRTFNDISQHWAKEYIEILAARQITNGKGNDIFDPDSNITRAEYVALIVRSLGFDSIGRVTGIYKDVVDGQWYYDIIYTGFSNDLLGKTDMFRPEDDITREEMMVIIANALKQLKDQRELSEAEVNEILSSYTDASAITTENRNAVALAIREGIITGRREDYLAIRENASRAETMVVVMRVMELLGM